MNFYKYHGTGNDFVLIDAFNQNIELTKNEIIKLCNRRFGIGADGLMLLKKHSEFDFEMDYYNPDGSGATFCGNGARCIVAFAKKLGIIKNETKFLASDGVHKARINNNIVKLQMNNPNSVSEKEDYFFMNTGSPHVVKFCENLQNVPVYQTGKIIRHKKEFQPLGTNVNFIEIKKNHIQVRTYEKGVEDETYSCGTGVIASALSYALKYKIANNFVNIDTKGGKLKVYFEINKKEFSDIWLQGVATFVFEGKLNIFQK